MMKNENNFEYKYSAPTSSERREIESIKNSYIKKEEQPTKLELLRKLDSKVRNVPIVVSLILGTFGILIFGLGLTMILEWKVIIWGIAVAFLGCVPMSLSYLCYKIIKKYLKNKYSEKIINLSNELLNLK